MGNTSSASTHSGDHSRSSQGGGGILDPRNRIERMYEKLIRENAFVKEQLRNTFREARILVLGRSGSGKTTLIRVLVGDAGPRSISEGSVGVQEIMTEWRHPDPDLPLIIHDSNGIDTDGNKRIADITRFLDGRLAHLSTSEFRERVHAAWYVFSAMDERVLDDGGLLEMLDGYGKGLPLLLIMTNTDVAEKLEADDVKVNPRVLERLLAKIKDVEKREMLKDTMVRVGNKIELDESTGEIMEGSRIDVEGMKLVFQRTKDLMDRKLWITWSSCQVMDMDAKLQASSKLIVSTRRKHVWASVAVASLPIAQQAELAAVFGTVTHGLVKIWNVAENLEKAIVTEFLGEERWHAVTQNLATNILGALMLGGAVSFTVLTAGMAAPSLLLAPATAALSQVGSTSTLIMSYALLVLGAIIYVQAQEMTLGIPQCIEEYKSLCVEFRNSEWVEKLSGFATHYSSVWEVAFREKRQRERLRSHIVNFFKDIMLMTSTSPYDGMGMRRRTTRRYDQIAAAADNEHYEIPSDTAEVIDDDRGQLQDGDDDDDTGDG